MISAPGEYANLLSAIAWTATQGAGAVVSTITGGYLTAMHYTGLLTGSVVATVGALAAWERLRSENGGLVTSATCAPLSVPLSMAIGYGIPYLAVPLAGGFYLLYLVGEVKVVQTADGGWSLRSAHYQSDSEDEPKPEEESGEASDKGEIDSDADSEGSTDPLEP
jgi:hypothetical protein